MYLLIMFITINQSFVYFYYKVNGNRRRKGESLIFIHKYFSGENHGLCCHFVSEVLTNDIANSHSHPSQGSDIILGRYLRL